MWRYFLLFIFLWMCTMCHEKKTYQPVLAVMYHQMDSAFQDTLHSHLIQMDELITHNEDSTEAVDEVFADFIYRFSLSPSFQKSRISFPLLSRRLSDSTVIEEGDWKHDSLYYKKKYFTLIFDHEQELDLLNDSALTDIKFEWIYLHSNKIKQYCFERKKSHWMLQQINEEKLDTLDDLDFYTFYHQFASDYTFQSTRIITPLKYVTLDPNDEFSIVETTMDLNQWKVFKPALPHGIISNIVYRATDAPSSTTRILMLKSVDNFFSNALYFKRIKRKWSLYKFEDLSY
ncbi:MAG: DUF4348 domain-containing protein [Bacteroidaceae bacterium]